MLISARSLFRYWGVNAEAIVHVGAHDGEELEAYESLGWGSSKVLWVEADPSLAQRLSARLATRLNHEVVQAVAWNRSGDTIEFRVASNSESSSALPLARHLDRYPDIHEMSRITLETTALGDLEQIRRLPQVDLLNLDVQGAELQALKGLGSQLRKCVSVYTEVNYEELYEGAASSIELANFLTSSGFVCVDEQDSGFGWGDQFWVKRQLAPKWPTIRRNFRRADSRARQFGSRLKGRGH